MTAAPVRIELDDREVLDALARLQARVGEAGLKDPMASIGQTLVVSTLRRFTTSSGPDGQPWKPNSDAVLRALLKRTPEAFGKKGQLIAKGKKVLAGKKPLIDSGELSISIHYQLIPGGVEVGTNRFANLFRGGAAIHQFGGQAGRGRKVTIPARPFLGVSAKDREFVLNKLREHLEGALNE